MCWLWISGVGCMGMGREMRHPPLLEDRLYLKTVKKRKKKRKTKKKRKHGKEKKKTKTKQRENTVSTFKGIDRRIRNILKSQSARRIEWLRSYCYRSARLSVCMSVRKLQHWLLWSWSLARSAVFISGNAYSLSQAQSDEIDSFLPWPCGRRHPLGTCCFTDNNSQNCDFHGVILSYWRRFYALLADSQVNCSSRWQLVTDWGEPPARNNMPTSTGT